MDDNDKGRREQTESWQFVKTHENNMRKRLHSKHRLDPKP